MSWGCSSDRYMKGTLLVLVLCLLLLCGLGHSREDPQSPKLTVRVNTFRRPDLLKQFVEYYHHCPHVQSIQVVWSEVHVTPPPVYSDKSRFSGKVTVEVHKNNSLSNRFRARLPIPTEAVISVDDDIAIPCDDLGLVLASWNANKRVLVGISPRLNAHHPLTGDSRYLHWQHTWWNGMYSVMLTKAALLHRDYLALYDAVVPPAFLTAIDHNRNCEDIAMAYVVATVAKAAPVWVKTVFYDTATSGISSGAGHFEQRSHCVQMLDESPAPDLTKLTNLVPADSLLLPLLRAEVSAEKKDLPSDWVVGYQKVEALTYSNTFALLYDPK